MRPPAIFLIRRMRAVIGLVGLLLSVDIFAIIEPDQISGDSRFITDFKTLKSSLNLDFQEELEEVSLPIAKIKKRLKKSEKDHRVEPVILTVTESKKYLRSLAAKLARKNKLDQLEKILIERVKDSPDHPRLKDKKIIELKRDDFRLISPKAFSRFYTRRHRSVTLNTENLNQNQSLKNKLMTQLGEYLDKDNLKYIDRRIQLSLPIKVDESLLPKFAKKVVKKYSVFRGPNCFHAALSFVAPQLPRSNLVNIKEEHNYHRAMINYDELWRILRSGFYEVDASKFDLKYGDLLIYFDYEEDQPTSYRWIKHASAYLFGSYAFSKGSKSANSPYTVKTLSEEWDTWSRASKKLGIKVFRKLENNVKYAPASELTEWLY